MIAKLALYVAVFASVMALHKQEELTALVVFALLATSIALMPPKDRLWMTVATVAVGMAFTVADYVGVRLAAWQYNHAARAIPLWLPLVWMMVGLFAFDAFNMVRRSTQI